MHLQTLAEDFVASQPKAFDYNAIIRQEEIESKQKNKDKKKGQKGVQFGAWRNAPGECVASGEFCYVGDTCCGGGECGPCNKAPCTCE